MKTSFAILEIAKTPDFHKWGARILYKLTYRPRYASQK
nr:MAG TPA: hypothetical protein [Caudoviricetes sp.]